jgi:inosine-uridine nucleoside N-ribohydrolase
MGGAIGEGNRTPAAEFNIWADPEARSASSTSGIDVTMVGLDVTHQALITPTHTSGCAARPRRAMVAELMDFYARFHKSRYPTSTARRCTTRSAVAHLIDPSLMDVK